MFTVVAARAADESIVQDVASLYEGMDTSAIDGSGNSGTGGLSDRTSSDSGMLHFDFAYGAKTGMYGPVRFNLTKRNLKSLERKLAKDEAKLARSGNMSLKVLVRIEMNRQLIAKLKAHKNFSNGHGCIVYFDVAEMFEKANNDAAFNRTLVAAAARTMGDESLARAAESGNFSGAAGGAVVSSVGSSVRNSVQNSVRSSVQQSVAQSVTTTVTQTASQAASEAASSSPDTVPGVGGNNPDVNNHTGGV